MRKRLDAVEEKLEPDPDRVVFDQLPNESFKQFDERFERWKAGEKVAGQDRPYTKSMQIIRVGFVDTIGQAKR